MTDDPKNQLGGKSEMLIYQFEDGQSRIQVRLEGDTVWLPQALMPNYSRRRSRISARTS